MKENIFSKIIDHKELQNMPNSKSDNDNFKSCNIHIESKRTNQSHYYHYSENKNSSLDQNNKFFLIKKRKIKRKIYHIFIFQ